MIFRSLTAQIHRSLRASSHVAMLSTLSANKEFAITWRPFHTNVSCPFVKTVPSNPTETPLALVAEKLAFAVPAVSSMDHTPFCVPPQSPGVVVYIVFEARFRLEAFALGGVNFTGAAISRPVEIRIV